MDELCYVSAGTPEMVMAHAINNFHTCRELSRHYDVTLIYPLTIKNFRKVRKLKRVYRENGINLVMLPAPSLAKLFGNDVLDRMFYGLMVLLYGLKKNVFYVRDGIVASILSKFKRVVFEVHVLEHILRPGRLTEALEKSALKNSREVVVINQQMAGFVSKYNKNVRWVPCAHDDSIFYPREVHYGCMGG